jgi:trigger factor
MQSQISEISSVLVEVSVQVPWPDVEKAIEGSYNQLGRTAKVKGFRPGKVPRNVLKQLFGARVKHDVVSNLVEAGLGKAVQQHALAVVAVPPLEAMPELKQGEPLAFKAKLEVRPKIENVDIEGITLTRQAVNVSDDDVGQVIERLRQQNAATVAVDPARPSIDTDIITCDFQVAIEGTPRPDLAATERDIDLTSTILPELKAGLVGKNVGDKVHIELTFPTEQGGEFAGKPGVFDVEIKAIKQKQLPELDDEFAKDLEHASLDELKQKTRERLEAGAKERAEESLREQLIEKLVEKNQVDVPPSLVKQQQDAMLQEYVRILRMTGQPPRDAGPIEQMAQDAERRVRAGLLLGAVARLKSIKLEAADVDKKLGEMAQRTGKHIAKVKAELKPEQREAIEGQLLEEKLLEYLLGQATITESAT